MRFLEARLVPSPRSRPTSPGGSGVAPQLRPLYGAVLQLRLHGDRSADDAEGFRKRQLHHDGVPSIGRWFLQFLSRCQHLGEDNLCQIYETRPQICRDLQPTECEFALGPGDLHYFTNLGEFERWQAEQVRQRRHRAQRRRRKKDPSKNGRSPSPRR